MFDLTDVGYVKRITVGSDDPNNLRSEEEVQKALDLLNTCLSSTPKGTILGIEKNFNVLNVGEHQVVLQCMVYHVGFPRKPYWLED
jgi:hypothetical protein